MAKVLAIIFTIVCYANLAIAAAPAANVPESPAQSGSAKSNEQAPKVLDKIEASEVWARPSVGALTASGSNSVVYLVIKNYNNKDYNLIGASAMSVANNVELHQSFTDEKGISKMRRVDQIVLPAVGPEGSPSVVSLAPGGLHIMLFDLKRALKVGDKFKLELLFDQIGAKTVEVVVK